MCMKKAIKILSVVAVVALISAFFCGCDALDYRKSIHGLISDNNQTVSYLGKTFVRLPDGIPYYFNSTASNRLNITREDVPVLLSESYGVDGFYDNLNGILAVNNDIEYTAYNTSSNSFFKSTPYYYYGSEEDYFFFCMEENYEEYSQFKTEDADRIGFDDYSEDYNTNVLSSETSQEILGIIKEGNVMSSETYIEAMEKWWDCFNIYKCNKAMTLKGSIDNYEVYIDEDENVYLANYITETAAKLSDKAAEEITREFYGY